MQDNPNAVPRWTPNPNATPEEAKGVEKKAVAKSEHVNISKKTGLEKTTTPSSITIGTQSFFRSTSGRALFPRR